MCVEEEPDGKPWYYDVKMFLQGGAYPVGATTIDKGMIRRLACQLFLNGTSCIKNHMTM